MEQFTKHKLTWGERHIITGEQRILIRLLRLKFKKLPDELIERIKAIVDETILEDITDQILFINSLDDLKLPEPA